MSTDLLLVVLNFQKKQLNIPRWLAFGVLLAVMGTAAVAQSTASSSEDRQIIHYGVEDGLSQGSVYSMLKDSRGFMWFTSLEGLNRFDGHHFKVYYPKPKDTTSLRGTITLGLIEDPYGNIWVGTEVCLNRYLRQKDAFDFVFAQDEKGQAVTGIHYPFYADSTEVWYINESEGIVAFNYKTQKKRLLTDQFHYQWNNSIINSVLPGPEGVIWIRQSHGLASFDSESGAIKHYFSDLPSNAAGPRMAFICHLPLADGTLWLGIDGGIIHFIPTTKEWTFHPIDPRAKIADIRRAPDGLLYLGTEGNGLYLYRPEEKALIDHITTENSELEGRSTANIYLDDQELLWINTDPLGIDLLFPKRNGFRKYGPAFFENYDFASSGIRCFVQSPDGNIWIGSEEDGIFVFDPDKDAIIRHIRPHYSLGFPENHAAFIHFDQRGQVWVGTYNGLFFSPDGKRFSLVENGLPPTGLHPAHECWDMIETPEGYLFVGTSGGLFFIPPGEKRAYPVDSLQGSSIGDIQHFGDHLLLAELHNGFWTFHYNEWITRNHKKEILQNFHSDFNVKHLSTQGDSILWLATTTGLLKIRLILNMEEMDLLKHFHQGDGLPSSYIYSALRDEDGMVWLSTNRGLARLNPRNEQIRVYGPEDNVQGYEFNTNSYLKSNRGDLYFGGTKGFNRFRPPLDENPARPAIQITGLEVNDRPFDQESYIGELDRLRLAFRENTFQLQFAAIDYWSKGDNRYRVKLAGYDQDWIELEEGAIRYTRVPPGEYTFQILAANGNGRWIQQPKTLEIQVAYPWFWSPWSIFVYLLVIGFLVWRWLRIRRRRKRLRRQLLERKAEAARLRELEDFKTRFYTNFSHDFRTPLTVIMGAARQLSHPNGVSTADGVRRIQQNSKQLLQMVDQLLDISKLESGKLKPEPVQTDVVALLQQWIEDYRRLANDKSITLELYTSTDCFFMDIDVRFLYHIVNNLLGNALKFTPAGGKVCLSVTPISEERLEIEVTDNGIGVAPENAPHIFDRFYSSQPNNGSGLGLSFAKELAELMGATLRVESEPGKGSSFCLELPVSRQALLIEAPASSGQSNPLPAASLPLSAPLSADAPRILIVDDNEDMRHYLCSLIKSFYHLTTARNSEEALLQITRQPIDLVISDVMMAETDEGFTLCQQLKSREATAHLPIILLTARGDHQSLRQGLMKGADAYLTKPFDEEELLIRIRQLLTLRATLEQKYSRRALQSMVDQYRLTPTDQQLLEQLQEGVLQHLSDRSFGVSDMARLTGKSTTAFNEWLQAIVGLTPSEFLRQLRLEMAHQLILRTRETIDSIASQTGFTDGSYLSKKYKEKFGHTPRQARKSRAE